VSEEGRKDERYAEYLARIGERLQRRGYVLVQDKLAEEERISTARLDLLGYYGPLGHQKFDGVQRVAALAWMERPTADEVRRFSAQIFQFAMTTLNELHMEPVVCMAAVATRAPAEEVVQFVEGTFLFRLPSLELPAVVDLEREVVYALRHVPIWGKAHVDKHLSYLRRLFAPRVPRKRFDRAAEHQYT